MGDRNLAPSIDKKPVGCIGEKWSGCNEIENDADEFNQAPDRDILIPYFIGENVAYPMYNYLNDSVSVGKDPARPTNYSVNNTGINELPPAQPAFISYPYRNSEKFPLVGSGARCAVGGPIYHQSNFKNSKRPYPGYYEGKWLAADLSRGWIMSISMKETRL